MASYPHRTELTVSGHHDHRNREERNAKVIT
jgi:hypothetical protein